MRCFNPEIYDTMKKRLFEFAKGFEIAYNCKVNVKIEDAIQANKITSLLMGNVVEGRKQLIINESKSYKYTT